MHPAWRLALESHLILNSLGRRLRDARISPRLVHRTREAALRAARARGDAAAIHDLMGTSQPT